MTLAQRKTLLLLECSCDRLELGLAARRSHPLADVSGKILSAPWLDTALALASPILPKKLRWLAFAFKIWRSQTK